MKNQLRVIIAGAGLGGLVLAHGLRSIGLDVQLVERDTDPESRHQGYRIQLDEPGLTGLQRCLPESLAQLCLDTAGTPPPRVTILNRHLEQINEKVSAHSPVGRPRAFDRATLRRILLAGLGRDVQFGSGLKSYRLTDNGSVDVTLAGGKHLAADVLVGADGVGSVVRSQLLPGATMSDAGLRLIYGKIELDSVTRNTLPHWAFESIFTVVTGGPGHPHVGIGPVEPHTPVRLAGLTHSPPIALPQTPGYLACMVGAPAGHPSMPPGDELRLMTPAALRAVAVKVLGSDWHSDVHRLVGAWTTPSLVPLRISTARRLGDMPTGPVTLIGDAVHPMSPVLAMGANTAIRDAAELTTELAAVVAGSCNLLDAIANYQSRMIAYAQAIVVASRETGQSRVGQR
jgi:2-polyprenyl-6-methoxyphenol hydroxylase-like FAD-dependent oxidoreductase